MKSAFHFIMAAALTSLLAGCGQKGPLYLSGKPAQATPALPAPQTVPALPSTSP